MWSNSLAMSSRGTAYIDDMSVPKNVPSDTASRPVREVFGAGFAGSSGPVDASRGPSLAMLSRIPTTRITIRFAIGTSDPRTIKERDEVRTALLSSELGGPTVI